MGVASISHDATSQASSPTRAETRPIAVNAATSIGHAKIDRRERVRGGTVNDFKMSPTHIRVGLGRFAKTLLSLAVVRTRDRVR